MKRLAGQTAIYGVSNIVARFINWALVPYYTRVLPATGDYGTVTNLYAWTALFLVLLTYGMETGFFRFINKSEEKHPLNVYSSILYCTGFTSTLFIAFILIFSTPLSSMLEYADNPEFVTVMGCVVAMDAFCCIPFAYLRYKNKAVRFVSIKTANVLLNIVLNLFFLLLCPVIHARCPELIGWFYNPDYGVGYIVISNLLTTLITLFLLVPDMIPGWKAKFDPKILKPVLKYSFPFLILGIAGILNQTVDKIIFTMLFEDKVYARSQLGIYGACFKIGGIMMMFIQAFRYAYEPFVFAKNRDGDSKATYSEAMKYFIIFSFVIFLGVMFYIDIIKHFVPSDYYSGLKVVPVFMLGELFFGIYFNLSIWYKLTDRTKWGAYFSITGCIVTVAVIVGFVPKYGFIACAYASFVSNLLMMLLSYFVGRKYYPVKYDLKSALVYSILCAACYLAAMSPQIDSDVLRITYRSVILLVFVGVAYLKDFRGRR